MGIAANWSRENLAWAAGLFEGEGSITRHRRNETYLVLSMSDEDVVRRFCDIIGHGRVYGPYYRENSKPMWRWQCSGSKNNIAIIAALLGFLGNRRRARAEIAMQEMALVRSQGTRFCKRGHEFDERNTILERGSRVCRRCKYDGINARAKKKRAQKNVPIELQRPNHGGSVVAPQIGSE